MLAELFIWISWTCVFNAFQITEAVRIDDTPVARIYSEKLHSHGLVTVVKNKFFCHCCRKNYCDHSLYFRNLTLDRVEEESCPIFVRELFYMATEGNINPNVALSNKYISKSWRPLPFDLTEEMVSCMKSGLLNKIPVSAGLFQFVPSDTSCRHCHGALNTNDPISSQWIAKSEALVITNNQCARGRGNLFHSIFV